jgi:hypothetical protein
MRYGDERGGEREETQLRKEAVRTAFNSPFWPFVLATTSIGQEGLDFHPFCHAVVHWNLPSNPVGTTKTAPIVSKAVINFAYGVAGAAGGRVS